MNEMNEDQRTAALGLALVRAGHLTEAALRESLLSARNSSAPAYEHLSSNSPVTNHAIAATLSATTTLFHKSADIGVSAVPISSDMYPPMLRKIADAPPIIYVRGNVAALHKWPGIAIVGTRKATEHGITIAQRLAMYFGSRGFSVVSGLALGIDAAAHEGALAVQAPTVAVLAHGLEKASPKTNSPLAERILESKGVWVSEHALGTPARPEYFVLRNRIQVGLSAGSIIVEGEERSGSATQAEFCLRNRRLLCAVLPHPGSRVAIQNQLPAQLVLKRGAMAVRSRDDYAAVADAIEQRAAELAAGTEGPAR